MKAAFLAVGSELLGTDRVDTNSLRLAVVLERYGAELIHKAVVGDDETAIARELDRLRREADVVVVSGGLGPTRDDVTREAAAGMLGRAVQFDAAVAAEIERRFADHGLRMPAVNRRQAEVIDGARLIPNRRGTAPGMILEDAGGGAATTFFLLPGVPTEFDGMVASHLEPWLAERSGGAQRETRTLKVASLPESEVEERILPVYEEVGRESISILARPGEIRLRFFAVGDAAQRRARLDAIERRLRERVGRAVFAGSEEETLEGVVGDLLRAAGRTVATAESCTGGLVAERLTRVPGSSDYFIGGAVTYTNELKERLLGVPEDVLVAHGAVSEPVARAMADGVRRALGADYGIGVTGIAGPGGGSDEKPVGTVHMAVTGPDEAALHRRVRFPGDRARVRQQASQLALELLRRLLLGAPADGPDIPGPPRGTSPGGG